MRKCVTIISPLGYTGLSYYDYSLSESLQEYGYDVTLITSSGWKISKRPRKFKLIYTYRDPNSTKSTQRKLISYLISTYITILYILKYTPPESIIHFEMSELPCVDCMLFLIIRIKKRRLIYTPHEITHNKNYLANNFFMGLMYKLADKVVVLNDKNIVCLTKIYGVAIDKVSVVPHGNYSYFTNDVPKNIARDYLNLNIDDNILLLFGTIREDKGVDVALDALKLLHNKVKLLIAGKPFGNLNSQIINQMIASKKQQSRVIFKGEFISDAEVDYYFCASDIILLPYKRIFESGILKLAQSYGRAVICSDLPEFKDGIEDKIDGLFFSTNDPVDLAKKISAALTNREFEKMGERSARKSQTYNNWNKISKMIGDIYEES